MLTTGFPNPFRPVDAPGLARSSLPLPSVREGTGKPNNCTMLGLTFLITSTSHKHTHARPVVFETEVRSNIE
ncbi:unnamed protein product [Protopolystoma xenopodis]|uniref:Uncharacterized protein n=1 Tax=Protopolystoma xenopodis TaxID=117903 RepID=A0A3S5FGL9_9PLAT|nr:unnamed protein product [Protopolystoma xenopodis]